MDNSIENSDLAKQYQDILDRYSKELSSSEPVEPEVITPVVNEPITPPPVPPSTPPTTPISIASTIPAPVFESVSPQTNPPANNFFKYLFFVSLLIFLGVFGAIAYTMLIVKPSETADNGIAPTGTIETIPTSSVKYCEANDQKIKQGDTFPAADGCNTCSCGEDLTITCTLKACEATPSVKATPTLKATPTSKVTPTTTVDTPLSVATKYLDAYVKGDWTTTQQLLDDSKFDQTIASSYGFVSYKILSSKFDVNKNYYHVYINFTDKNGTVIKVSPPSTPLEVLMVKSDSGWKPLTWYFIQ